MIIFVVIIGMMIAVMTMMTVIMSVMASVMVRGLMMSGCCAMRDIMGRCRRVSRGCRTAR